MTTMSSHAANVNVGVAAKFHHRDAGSIGEQGVKRDHLKCRPTVKALHDQTVLNQFILAPS
jgi:hypothetical protein